MWWRRQQPLESCCASLAARPRRCPPWRPLREGCSTIRQAGALLVAEGDGALVGVLAASWQSAMHVPGRYALIQDLWVHPAWRSGGVGAGLLAALFELARERGLARVEVGLPGERFAGLAATEAFYLANGFTPLGPRMRLGIA